MYGIRSHHVDLNSTNLKFLSPPVTECTRTYVPQPAQSVKWELRKPRKFFPIARGKFPSAVQVSSFPEK